MAGVDQGAALVYEEVEASGFVRAYLTGLGYEGGIGNGVGTPTTGNTAYNALAPAEGELLGPRTDVVKVGPVRAPGTEYQVVTADLDAGTAMSELWWDRVHVLPRSAIDFGSIITLVQSDYEIHSAFRSAPVTENLVTNNALPGVNLPNNSPSVVLRRNETMLDPTTTGQTLSSLGTMVKLKIEATQDGLPQFDTSVVFGFIAPANDVSLFVVGVRIIMIPMAYETPTQETLAWLTDVIESVDGSEQRIALRKQPRQSFDVRYVLDANERQRMQALLFDWTDNTFGLPLWHENVKTTAAVSIGATAYLITGGDEVDFRVGGLAFVSTDNATFDVITVAAVTATQLTASDPSLNSYPAGTAIMPLRLAAIGRTATGVQHLNELEDFSISFEVLDNDTGALVGSDTPGFWGTYNGRVLFDDCNVVQSRVATTYPRRIYRIDNKTGVVTQSSSWDRSKRGSQKGFMLRNRAEIYQFRTLLSAIRGRQKAVYLPTNSDDLTVVADIVLGTSVMRVTALEYLRLSRARAGMDLFKITFADNTSLVRTVLSSSTVSATVEELSLNDTWPANQTATDVVRVQYYELVRFDTDEIRLRYPRLGLANAEVPVLRVFDDN